MSRNWLTRLQEHLAEAGHPMVQVRWYDEHLDASRKDVQIRELHGRWTPNDPTVDKRYTTCVNVIAVWLREYKQQPHTVVLREWEFTADEANLSFFIL